MRKLFWGIVAALVLHAAPQDASEDERIATVVYTNRAAASLRAGETVQAEEYARHAVELAQRSLPEGHPHRAAALNNLAQACRFNGNYLEAERYYREAIAIWEANSPSNADLGRGLMNLAAFYHERGREAGAEQLYVRAAGIFETTEPELLLVVRNELADVLRAQSRYTESEKLARASIAEMQVALHPEDPRMIRAWTNWARLLAETKRSSEAAKVMRRAALAWAATAR